MIVREGRASGDKRSGSSETWQKVRFDFQIIAIARAFNQETIYTTDRKLGTMAERLGLQAIHVDALPLPPEDDQQDLFAEKDLPGDTADPNDEKADS